MTVTLDELDIRTAQLQSDLRKLREDVEGVKKMALTFANAIVDVQNLSDTLTRAHAELVDRDAKMITSIKQIVDSRTVPQEQQSRERMRAYAMIPGVVVLLLGMWQRLSPEVSIMLAGAVWLAMQRAVGLVKTNTTNGNSVRPGKT